MKFQILFLITLFVVGVSGFYPAFEHNPDAFTFPLPQKTVYELSKSPDKAEICNFCRNLGPL